MRQFNSHSFILRHIYHPLLPRKRLGGNNFTDTTGLAIATCLPMLPNLTILW